MKELEKFSELSVDEAHILAEALTFWCNCDILLEPSIIQKMLPDIAEKDHVEAELLIKEETKRILSLKREDTSNLKHTLNKIIERYAKKEILDLVGE